MTANDDFICEVCGRPDLVPSMVTICANYGSQHDGETVTVKLCGECVDWLLDGLVRFYHAE